MQTLSAYIKDLESELRIAKMTKASKGEIANLERKIDKAKGAEVKTKSLFDRIFGCSND